MAMVELDGVKIEDVLLTSTQRKACEMMGITDVNALINSAVSSAIKGKLNYYRNGATTDAANATHSLVKRKKDGTAKTIYYKGGLKEGAEKAFEMAKSFLPASVSKAEFVNNALAEVDAVLSELNGSDAEDSE